MVTGFPRIEKPAPFRQSGQSSTTAPEARCTHTPEPEPGDGQRHSWQKADAAQS